MKKQKLTWNGQVLTVEYPTIGKKLIVDVSKYDEKIRTQAMYHGFGQKFGDAASGKLPTEKYEMVQRIHASLQAGAWELEGSVDNSPIILEAVSRIKGKSVAAIEKTLTQAWNKMPEDAQDEYDDYDAFKRATCKTWSTNVKVKAEVAKIRAERAQKDAEGSTDELEIPGI